MSSASFSEVLQLPCKKTKCYQLKALHLCALGKDFFTV